MRRRIIEIETHARVTKKGRFQCLLCSEDASTQTLFHTEIGLMAHMLYGHIIAPHTVIVAGWTQDMAENLKKQSMRNNWNLDEDIDFFLRERKAQEARIFKDGKVKIVMIKIRNNS